MKPTKAFSKFSVWDKDLRDSIEELASACAIDKDQLSDFFYKEGLTVFNDVQMQKLSKFRNPYDKNQLALVTISSEFIVASKEVAFDALRDLLLKQSFVTELNKEKLLLFMTPFTVKASIATATFVKNKQRC